MVRAVTNPSQAVEGTSYALGVSPVEQLSQPPPATHFYYFTKLYKGFTPMNEDNFVTPETLPLVLSVPDLAKILHIGRNSAYQLVNSGRIRAIRIGKNIRIPQSALLEYLNHPEKT